MGIFSFLTYGQPGGNVIPFTVNKPDVVISIAPDDSTFWVEKRNLFTITVEEGKSKIGRVRLSEGLLRKIGPDQYSATFDTVCETVLKVYEIQPDGESRLAFSRLYKVREKPLPTVTVAGVKADSSVGIKRLLHIAELQVDLEGSPVRPTIKDYIMVTGVGGEEKRFRGTGNALTLSMKNEIRRMTPGQTIEFRNINVLMPDRNTKTIPSIAIFLVETDEFQIGRSGLPEGVGIGGR